MTEPNNAAPAMAPELWPLDRIKPYPKNARTHPPAQIAMLADLIKRYGADQPIVVDETGEILKGHGRLASARYAGLTEFPVVVRTGMTSEQKRAMRLEDNQVALLSGWDAELIRGELIDLKSFGYDVGNLGFQQVELATFGLASESSFPTLSSGDRAPFQQMTFTLHDDQVALVKKAMEVAKARGPFNGSNENSNGNAIARICADYCKGDKGSAGNGGDRKRNNKKVPLQRKSRPQ